MDEPQFVNELAAKIGSREAPVAPLPRNLQKRRVPSYVRPGFRRSLIFHGAVVGVLAMLSVVQYFTNEHLARDAKLKSQLGKNAIRVDIVDLPKLKLEELNKVDLTQEANKAEETVDAPLPPPPPSSKAMIDRTQPAKKTVAKAPPEEKVPEKLKEIRERLRADLRRKELIAKLKSHAKEGEGRQLLAGNIVSEGYSLTGDVATDSDIYSGKVLSVIKKHWAVPAWMQASKLRASIVIRIASDGQLLSKEFLKKSGNAEFDSDALKAVEGADPFPPPPESLKRSVMEDGIECAFPEK